MAVKPANPKPTQIELPPEDVPFDDVIRKLLTAPPPHEPRPSKARMKAKATRKKRSK